MQRSVCCIKAIRKLYTPGTGKSITDKAVRYLQGKPTVLPLFRMEKNTYPSTNGTAHDLNGHEVVYDPDQLELQLEGMLPTGVVTAKKESPVAENEQTHVSEQSSENQEEEKEEKKKSARYVEAGHAVNVQNLRLVTQRIVGFGSSYIQGSPLYAVPHLESVYNIGMTSLQGVVVAKQAYDVAVDKQEQAFGNVKDMSTRTKNFFIWCGVPAKAIERMESLNHEIQGTRVIPIKDGDSDDHISASHQSRTQQIQHVDALIQFLQTYPEYLAPEDITVAAWIAKRDQMDSAFLEENITSSNLKAARIQRNVDIYKTTTGVVEIGLGAKRVVLAIYGFNSPQYAAVKGIKFTRIKGWKNL